MKCDRATIFVPRDERSAARPRPLRVLHLMLSAGPTSAPFHEFACAAARRGQHVTACAFFPDASDASSPLPIFSGDGSMRGFLRALRTALEAGPYDLIHCHALHVVLLLPWAGYRRLARFGRAAPPRVLTMHCSYEHLRARHRAILPLAYRAVDQVNYCSRAAQSSYPRWLRRLARRPDPAVPNGVDLARIDRALAALADGPSHQGHAAPTHEPHEHQPAHHETFTLVWVGRLVASKNLGVLIEAVGRLRDPALRLVLVGEGPQRTTLEAAARRAGLAGRFEITGLVPRDEVWRRLAAADLFVSASETEGLPLAVLEALACRRTALLSDIAAHREIVADLAGVPLVPPDDVPAWSQAIERMRYTTPEERAIVGLAARRHVEEHFSLDAMHARYEGLYAALLAGADVPLGLGDCRPAKATAAPTAAHARIKQTELAAARRAASHVERPANADWEGTVCR